MPRLRLTDALAAKAVVPPGKAEFVLSDTDVVGFELRVRGDAKSWILRYRPLGGGRAAPPKPLRLGAHPSMKAAEARTQARTALGRVAAGGDPSADRQAAKKRSQSKLAVLLDRYDADLERRGYVNRKVVVAGLRSRMKALLDTDIRDVTGEDVANIMDAARRAGMVGAAEDFRSRAGAFFAWCIAEAKVLATNPLAGQRKQRATRLDRVGQQQHGRALNDEEVAQVWEAAQPSTVFHRYIRFLLLTGCRRGEGAGLTWAMVDRTAALINLPAAFVKQGRGHTVPITPDLAAIFDACPRDARSDLVFASAKTGGCMSGWTPQMKKFARLSKVDFQLHDLRRSVRTGLSRLGVSSETAELALGHARSNLEARYNRDEATTALRDAFERWASHVVVRQSVVSYDKNERKISIDFSAF